MTSRMIVGVVGFAVVLMAGCSQPSTEEPKIWTSKEMQEQCSIERQIGYSHGYMDAMNRAIEVLSSNLVSQTPLKVGK